MPRFKSLSRMASAARLTTMLLALRKLVKHPQTPRTPQWVAFAVLAHASSPIDLIPDFIPVRGLLDGLLLLPSGVVLVAIWWSMLGGLGWWSWMVSSSRWST